MYSEPNFKIIELAQEDILTESNPLWDEKDEIVLDGELEFQ